MVREICQASQVITWHGAYQSPGIPQYVYCRRHIADRKKSNQKTPSPEIAELEPMYVSRDEANLRFSWITKPMLYSQQLFILPKELEVDHSQMLIAQLRTKYAELHAELEKSRERCIVAEKRAEALEKSSQLATQFRSTKASPNLLATESKTNYTVIF
jgi:hypothetical protein